MMAKNKREDTSLNKKEKIYAYISHNDYKPLTIDELCVVLDVPKSDYNEFKKLINELLNEGKIVANKKGRLKKAGFSKGIYATIRLMRSGNAFAKLSDLSDGDGEEIFIERKNLNYAFDGDTVSIKLLNTPKNANRKSREGIVDKIVSRASDELVGTIIENDYTMAFLPDKLQGYTARVSNDGISANIGEKVVARIMRYPDAQRDMKVRIVEVIGEGESVATLTECIIREEKIPVKFSDETLIQASKANQTVSDEEKVGRTDYRGDRVITIDGEDARDLDDAICVKKNSDGSFTLYVHIADVSYYVRENTAIDLDAYERATSVYFPDRVIPMLPKELSNGICSLNEGVDRLTMSVEMQIDKNGNMYAYSLCEGLICSRHRMTYTTVSAILDGDDKLSKKYSDIYDDIHNMKELALLLKARRHERGAIDFNFPEPKVVLDESGKVSGVKIYETGISNEIIEQFMLLANEAMAKYAESKDLPFVYRVHEVPSEEKLITLQKYLSIFNIPFALPDTNAIKPHDIQEIVASIKGSTQETAISTLCLRSMMKARYSPENLGHFGLASEFYCHFTSPIRRYPDLAIHRILRESITKGINEKRRSYLVNFVDRASLQSSDAEVRAVDAERAADKVCECFYMEQFVGDEFDGVISSVTDFGLFVEVNGCIEGFVSMAQLCDDYYVYEEDLLRIRGERTGRVFCLGDKVRVRLVMSNARMRKIDFEIADMQPNNFKAKPTRVYSLKNKKHKAKKQFKSFVKSKSKRKRR